jgi:ABC-type lipoprotein export system ATPase subunit/ABC-type antimicrobial peptide transport system permease subunit
MIEVRDLEKVYSTKERDFVALKQVNLTFEAGEFIAVLGESGSGKTTFLNMISGVDVKSSGKIFFNGEDVDTFNDSKWRQVRNQDIGFIFQRFNLIEHLTVIENVVLPLILTGSDNIVARDIARRLLQEVELEGLEDKLASELSGGQRQRVAIARTIIINPTIILADEPTGALDSSTAVEIMKLLQKFADGRIIIMVTHDEDLAYKNATRVVRLHDGEIISDEIVKEKNPVTRDKTNRLLSYETKITRRLRRRLFKQYPDLEGKLELGKRHRVPLERKYIANNPVFTRKIARENYKQKHKINRRILWSFVISISMLLIVNIVMKNITAYNFNLFDINNNYQQYLVTDYTDSNQVITALQGTDNIDEASLFYEHYVQEVYLVDDDEFLPITSSKTTYNKGVFSPKMVSLPVDQTHFYLNSQLLAGAYPVNENDIIVSSEFLLVRFYGFSLEQLYNQEYDGSLPRSLSAFVGQSLYICGETLIEEDIDITLGRITSNCYEFVISGVLNSLYKGVDYTGNIFVPLAGFDSYIEHLRTDKGFTRVDEYYDRYISFYLKDFEQGISIDELSTELDVDISNPQLREYNETKTLEDMLNYMYLAIFISLIVISGTIDINIVASSVTSRIREIGIYSSIGVSKKSIRNMFVFETLETALRIVLLNGALYVLIAFGFRWLYKFIVVDLTVLEPIFGVNEMFSYQIGFAVYTILGAVVFLFASVLVPSFRAANMRAIDALRSG